MAFKGALMLSEQDNVATSLEEIAGGADVDIQLGDKLSNVVALEQIPFGFKIAVADIAKDAHVIKYGESIGVASEDIKAGNLVHIHNLGGARGRGDLAKGGAQ
ncbi:MAG: UxaA family hydrolase [Pseudomonadales bacterium]|jgi:altronate dehydratase small subunit|nr:UxaA family hydrolase [Pseudomonadales bacterium]MDP7597209.1 UxaA family hydrolase [Pseudomonadales bacterium]HJN51909.1 UxaA family hydrolase [Pseudomonadales bacterium]|tara:strand:+ start:844 stop:1152 length:309 start_codon:yes stop_codon:yes gene_type:complete